MSIEKDLHPESGELIIDEWGSGDIIIVDAELDPVHCEISDDCVEMSVNRYAHVSLTRANLNQLLECLDIVEATE